MSYLNHVTGFRKDILTTRSVIVPGNYAIIEPDGIVKNTIPGFEGCEITILASPKLGASFVDYLLTVLPNGQNLKGFGDEEIETFLYILEGNLTVWNDDEKASLTAGGYFYSAPGKPLFFQNSGETVKAFLYKRRYAPLAGQPYPHTVTANINDVTWVEYEGMSDVLVKDFLPAATDLSFDMNMHILSFRPGACHGYIETHVQEHGAYIYSGEGLYNLDNEWIPVKKGDYLFMGAYCPQAAYGIGRGEDFAYVYSKDCNRDAEI